jgi:hypothetical protein
MKNKLMYTSYFNINTSYFQKLYKFNEIFNSLENTNFKDEEWAYLYIFPQFKLVIPCRLILEKFYLSDKHIKNVLYSARSQDLYTSYEFLPTSFKKPNLENISYDKSSNYILKINCKKYISTSTIKFISRLLYDKRINDIFDYYYIQRVLKKDLYLKSYIPYIGTLHIKADISVIDNIHLVTEFDTTLPDYFPSIFYSFREIHSANNYKEIKLKNFRSNYYLNKNKIEDPFHKEIIQNLLDNNTFKLIEYKSNQDIVDYLTKLDYLYCINFTYTLIKYRNEKILIIYFSNEDYLNRNFIFRNFNHPNIDEFIKSIIHLINNGQLNYKEIKRFVKVQYNIKFYPFNIPTSFFLSRKYKVLDLMNYIEEYLNGNFQKIINYFSSKRNYIFKKDDFY